MWALIVVVIGALADLLGWNLKGWFHSLWQTITTISIGSLIAGIALMVVQTSTTAYAWYAILKYAYPERTRWKDILAGYAVSVALNGFLPANLGTLVFLIMVTGVPRRSASPPSSARTPSRRSSSPPPAHSRTSISSSRIGGSFDIGFGFVHVHPAATIIVLGGGAVMIVLLVRKYWPKVVEWWDQGQGGRRDPRQARRVLRPRVPAVVHQLVRRARRGRRVPQRVRDPGQLRHVDARRRWQLARQCHVGHAQVAWG